MEVDPKMEHFGERVREARRRRGMTQRDLAGETGLSVQYISDIERGCAVGAAETIARLCRALDLSMDEIFLAAGYDNDEQENGSDGNAR